MPLHTLPAGRAVIQSMRSLGLALDYEVELERSIGNAGAAVDVAWYAAGDRSVPLMIFEVESSASSSMANNAMKVLARDVSDFAKPLFFFHVLLQGGKDNDRIAQLRSQWGMHNYRVYRLNDNGEVQRLFIDILAQHRRIHDSLSLAAIDDVLHQDVWIDVDRSSALDALQEYGFQAAYVRDLAKGSSRSIGARRYYLGHLLRIVNCETASDHSYSGYVGRTYGQLLEIGMLAAARDLPDKGAAQMLEAWQVRTGYGMRMIGPTFGLSRDYDTFVFGSAPFLYGLLGLLSRDRPTTFAWCVSDLASLLSAEQAQGIRSDVWLPAALWTAHLASAGMARSVPPHLRAGLLAAFNLARSAINTAGGVPPTVLDAPPPFVDFEDRATWLDQLDKVRIEVPTWDRLNGRYLGTGTPDDLLDWVDPFERAVEVLLNDEWASWDSRGLVRALRVPVDESHPPSR